MVAILKQFNMENSVKINGTGACGHNNQEVIKSEWSLGGRLTVLSKKQKDYCGGTFQ
jgi:hypothetical protein